MTAEQQKTLQRFTQLEKQLSQPEVITNQEKSKGLAQEYDSLKPQANVLQAMQKTAELLTQAKQTLAGNDPEFVALAREEIAQQTERLQQLESDLKQITAKSDPRDSKNTIIEIRAGTGGDEAALFAADLFRMYARYAERQGWETSLLSTSYSGIGGFKEVIFRLAGQNVFSRLKYEAGVHRVQRVPETEKSGRIHTSAATIAVLPEAKEIDFHLKPEELKIEATTAGGHGGQSVNTTYSAIRITHLPTKMVVQCQDERSQKQNRERAFSILRSRLLAQKQAKQHQEIAAQRKGMVKSGDRSEKVRTYNFPQSRVTDHRIKFTSHNLEAILDGDLDELIEALQTQLNKE